MSYILNSVTDFTQVAISLFFTYLQEFKPICLNYHSSCCKKAMDERFHNNSKDMLIFLLAVFCYDSLPEPKKKIWLISSILMV